VVLQVPRHCDFTTSNFGASGGASAVKEPGHFEGRKSSSQVTRSVGRSQQDFLWGALFYLKKVFLVVGVKT